MKALATVQIRQKAKFVAVYVDGAMKATINDKDTIAFGPFELNPHQIDAVVHAYKAWIGCGQRDNVLTVKYYDSHTIGFEWSND